MVEEKTTALYSCVQRELQVGLTRPFDSETPEQTLAQTLALRRGHCNPQGALPASLLNAAGLRARQRFVGLRAGVLRGVLDGFGPDPVLPSFVEVDVGEALRRVDGYIEDDARWRGANALRAAAGRGPGRGLRRARGGTKA